MRSQVDGDIDGDSVAPPGCIKTLALTMQCSINVVRCAVSKDHTTRGSQRNWRTSMHSTIPCTDTNSCLWLTPSPRYSDTLRLIGAVEGGFRVMAEAGSISLSD